MPRLDREPYVHVCAVSSVVYHLHVLPPTSTRVDTWVTIEGTARIASVPCSADGVLAWPARLSLAFRSHVEEALVAALRCWSP